MLHNAGVDQKISDAELIALFCKTQDQLEGHSEAHELNARMHDIANELTWRLLATTPVSPNTFGTHANLSQHSDDRLTPAVRSQFGGFTL